MVSNWRIRGFHVCRILVMRVVPVLPPSTFSSLLTSITTNFSQTANVGKVDEMNWPNLK